jgi:regulator of telomere elongation helicase 1
MKMLWQQGVRSIILTSGTLSPIPPLVQELCSENGHVVTGDRVFVGVVSTGPDGTSLNSSFNTRNDPKYIHLGAWSNYSELQPRVVPGGLLVFFTSYPLMKKCQDDRQAMGIWSEIDENKMRFLQSTFEEFKKYIHPFIM